jgi:hypothetical protein
MSSENTTYMTCILQKLWPKTDLKQIPDIWIAYAASTSEILLNPNIPTIQISEAKMKPRLKKYLKVVEKIIGNVDEIFLSDIESSGSEERNEEHRNEKEEREIEAGGGGEDDDQDVFFLVENDAKLKKRKHHKK